MVTREKQIQIPESLFNDIIELLIFKIRPGQPGRPITEKTLEQLNSILEALSKKQSRLICHKAYSKMTTAKNEDDFNTAKMNYLHYKND